jgi:hypothetical protein
MKTSKVKKLSKLVGYATRNMTLPLNLMISLSASIFSELKDWEIKEKFKTIYYASKVI